MPTTSILARCILIIGVLGLLACDEPIERLKVEKIGGPAAADVTQVVAGSEAAPRALALTPDHLWVKSGGWRATRVFDGGTFASVDTPGRRDSVVHARERWWWLENTLEVGPVLRVSPDGREWSDFDLPGTARDGVKLAAAAEPQLNLRLETQLGALYLIGARRIWRLDQSGEPIWHRVSLDGIGLLEEAEAFPAFIRNYLPRTGDNAFELLSVFGEQPRIYRRNEPDAAWMMVSSSGVVDEDLVASPDGAVVYIAAADGVYRSNDEGETWFRFWPTDAANLAALTVAADSSGDVGYALVAGTSDGTILRSANEGADWEVVRPGGASVRAVSSLDTSGDQLTVYAGTRGTGIWLSEDGGRTWSPANSGLGDARPLDIGHRADGAILLADPGGTWVLSSGLGENWNSLNTRYPASLLGGANGTVVTGTVDGTVVVQTSREDTVEFESLFREGEGPLLTPGARADLLPDRAVVLVRERPGTGELHAWSKARGTAVSSDNGGSWEMLDIDPSLKDALGGRPILDVQLDSKEGIYLTVSAADGIEIWYSDNGAVSWRAVRELSSSDALFIVLGPEDADAMLVVEDGRIERSLDGGATWREFEGPWSGLDVVDMAYDDQTLALLVDSRPGFEIMRIRDPMAVSRSVRRFALDWPENAPVSAPRDFEMNGGEIIMMSRESIWRLKRPGEESPLPFAATLLAVSLSILAACAVVFFVLRRI